MGPLEHRAVQAFKALAACKASKAIPSLDPKALKDCLALSALAALKDQSAPRASKGRLAQSALKALGAIPAFKEVAATWALPEQSDLADYKELMENGGSKEIAEIAVS